MNVLTFENLDAWRESMKLVRDVYTLTKKFPQEEKFGLTSQIQRAVVSIPSNIAEGHGRYSKAEFANFVSIAHGSLNEVRTQIRIAQMLNYISETEANDIVAKCITIGKIIGGLMKSLKA
jgi:four helix bundle protein